VRTSEHGAEAIHFFFHEGKVSALFSSITPSVRLPNIRQCCERGGEFVRDVGDELLLQIMVALQSFRQELRDWKRSAISSVDSPARVVRTSPASGFGRADHAVDGRVM
jgi:hypothetical protein